MKVSLTLVSHWHFYAMFRNADAKEEKKESLLNYEAAHIRFDPRTIINRAGIRAFSAFRNRGFEECFFHF